MKTKAVTSMGIPCPIIREGDNIVDIVVDMVLMEVEEEYEDKIYSGREQAILGIQDKEELTDMYGETYVPYRRTRYNIFDKDVIGITESIVARAAGQYITVDDIANDIREKFGEDSTITLMNPIYSRNRFAMILKGIARGAKKLIINMPDYDEVGNPRGINKFTGVNIEEYYKEICEKENCECEFSFDTTQNLIYCGLHDYDEWYDTWRYFSNHYTLKQICSKQSPDWGLLGTNKSTEERLKLFPSKEECLRVCNEVKAKIKEKIGKDVIVCVYGDGCFQDPVGEIWEFADPVTMPGYTDAELIESTPNEVKLKASIDNSKDDIELIKSVHNAKGNLFGKMVSMGTTPRVYRDLLASLMDLTSGSGDRATPVVLIKNYF